MFVAKTSLKSVIVILPSKRITFVPQMTAQKIFVRSGLKLNAKQAATVRKFFII